MQLFNNIDLNSVAKVINSVDPTNPQDLVTKSYADALNEGNNWKDNARVAGPANVNLATPGSTIDGITMSMNDRVVLPNQTDQKENGIYIYNGPSTLMTRSPDATTMSELKNAVVIIDEGTSAGLTYRQQTITGTIGTDDVVFVSYLSATPDASTTIAGKIELATQTEVNTGTATNLAVTPETLAGYSKLLRKYTVAVGDGTSTSLAVTHNLGTIAVHVQVFKASGNKEMVIVDIERTDTNTITLKPIAAPASASLDVVVIG